jgi:hypothetical protein
MNETNRSITATKTTTKMTTMTKILNLYIHCVYKNKNSALLSLEYSIKH